MSQQPQESVLNLTQQELESLDSASDGEGAGFGSLQTPRGLLPLLALEARAKLDGLLSRLSLAQTFINCLDEPLEATYIFPLPDRAAVTRFEMEVAGRKVEGKLRERGEARQAYDQAIETGHRASIAEEERSGVFTIRVGNLMPGERATVRLELAGTMPYADGEVTFRFPLVVAPRYIPGIPLSGPSVGDGVASDTEAVPDASRITPPVLLPGFPNPVRLALEVEVNETLAPVGPLRSSLHAVVEQNHSGVRKLRLQPGERLNRDFILRYRLGGDSVRTSLSVHPDTDEKGEGTFVLTVVPPANDQESQAPPTRDVVFVLDRSGSMHGWKMVAARRAVARMVETLRPRDRFMILAFDSSCECPPRLPQALVPATDHHRFLAAEYLAGLEARGGTEMARPLQTATGLLAEQESERDHWLILVTDGQVGNEDQLLRLLAGQSVGLRVLTLGIDQAVNEGFLRKLSALGEGGGLCELAETEDRLEAALETIHRRLGSPALRDLRIAPGAGKGLQILEETLVPARPPDLHAGAPLLLLGRYRGKPGEALTLQARTADGREWTEQVAPRVRENPAITWAWARGQVERLEDDYVVGTGNRQALEHQIVETSLRFGVLSRFTAFVAVDEAEVVNPGGGRRRVTQPVEAPQAWAAAESCEFTVLGESISASYLAPPASLDLSRQVDRISPSRRKSALDFLRQALGGSGRGEALSSPRFDQGASESKPAPENGLPPALPSAPLREAASRRLTECRALATKLEQEKVNWLLQVSADLLQWLEGLRRQKTAAAHLVRLEALVKRLAELFKASQGPAPELLNELGAETETILAELAGEAASGATPEKRSSFWK